MAKLKFDALAHRKLVAAFRLMFARPSTENVEKFRAEWEAFTFDEVEEPAPAPEPEPEPEQLELPMEQSAPEPESGEGSEE